MNIIIFSNQEKQLQEISLLIQQYMSQYHNNNQYQIELSKDDSQFQNEPIFDVAFLCLHTHVKQTLDFARKIKKRNPNCLITFIANNYDSLYDAFCIQAFQYMLYPLDISFFNKEFQRMLLAYKKRNFKFILHTHKGKILFRTKDIIYLETYYNQIKIITTDGTYLTNIKQKHYLKQILSTLYFVRIQRSYMINMNHIMFFTETGVLLKNKVFLPTSPLRKQEIMLEYNRFQQSRGEERNENISL